MTEHRDPVREDRLRTAAKAVLACGVGNLVGDKYRRRVEAFDALDDALDEAAPRSEPLDVAWAAFEAALPDGWSFWEMIEYSPDEGQPRRVFVRVRTANTINRFGMVPEVSASGPTPAAAVNAVHAALAPSEPTDG